METWPLPYGGPNTAEEPKGPHGPDRKGPQNGEEINLLKQPLAFLRPLKWGGTKMATYPLPFLVPGVAGNCA